MFCGLILLMHYGLAYAMTALSAPQQPHDQTLRYFRLAPVCPRLEQTEDLKIEAEERVRDFIVFSADMFCRESKAVNWSMMTLMRSSKYIQ